MLNWCCSRCVSLAIYYHIKNRKSDTGLDIFDEKHHPLTRDGVSSDYNKYNPDHRQIYKFIRTLFNAAQLTAECAIITLVYLERYFKNILNCYSTDHHLLLS